MVSTLVLFPLSLTLSPGVPEERGILCRSERKLRLLKRYDTITLPFQGGFNLRYILSLPKKDRILFHPFSQLNIAAPQRNSKFQCVYQFCGRLIV